jgi:hypothetical protein
MQAEEPRQATGTVRRRQIELGHDALNREITLPRGTIRNDLGENGAILTDRAWQYLGPIGAPVPSDLREVRADHW